MHYIETVSLPSICLKMTEQLYHEFQLGKLTLPGNLFLGPMAGYTDLAFRSICTECGADLTYTEMISAEGLVRDSHNTFSMLAAAPNENHLAVQLFGSSPVTMAKAASLLPHDRFCAIDINCGCPVPKVVKTGAGSALLRNPTLIAEIVHSILQETDLPVTVKIRLGWDSESINYLETGEAAEKGGASAICLHCRTRSQFYNGIPDISALTDLKKHSDIPIIGSGDLFTPEAAAGMMNQTGCDGIIFARGAVGRPYIFSQTRDLLKHGSYNQIPISERINLFTKQLELLAAVRNEESACKEMRKHVPFLLKGIPNSSQAKSCSSYAVKIEDYRLAFSRILDQSSL